MEDYSAAAEAGCGGAGERVSFHLVTQDKRAFGNKSTKVHLLLHRPAG